MNNYRKIAFIGLDGVPHSMLVKLLKMGVMPNLQKICEAGSLMAMETTQPPVSSVAWTSFMTGSNPADHGIFGFTDVQKNRIALKLPSFDDVQKPTLWNQHPNKRALIINLPFTYPARQLNGRLICGFVAPVFERAVYPESLIPWLKSINYTIDTDNLRARSNRGFLMKSLFENLNCLEQVSLNLSRDYWDILIVVITGTDRLHHFLFDAFGDATHPYHSDLINYYGRIDAFIEKMDSLLDNQTLRIFLSDHGFTELKTQIYLNNILKSLGYLKYVKEDPRTVDDIHPDSLAFALDPTRIHINTLERFGNIRMPTSRALETRSRLKKDLENLKLSDVSPGDPLLQKDKDDKLFSEVRFKEEVYSGHLLHLAPDLIVIPKRGFDVKATISAQSTTAKDIFTGMHTHDDAFLLIGDPDWASKIDSPSIEQVARLIPWSSNLFLS